MKVMEKKIEQGLKVDFDRLIPQPTVELFGHVTLVEGYSLPNFAGCHALVNLRDENRTVAVLSQDMRLQSLLETALETGNLIAFWGRQFLHPPTPMGGTWTVDVYDIDAVILYNMN